MSGCSRAHSTNSAQADITRAYGRPSTSRKQTAHTGASASAAHDEPPAAMSPISVVPNRNDSASPVRTSAAMALASRVRRWAITCRNQPTKSGSGGTTPRAPVRSRCVWALTRPGMMAALPKSMSGLRAPAGSTDSIRSPRTVTVPPGSGGPVTGNTQRAERVCSLAGPGIAGSVLRNRSSARSGSLSYSLSPASGERGGVRGQTPAGSGASLPSSQGLPPHP